MSSYITSPIRKRRSDDESSESDEEYPPPVKKQRNCNGDSNIKRVIVSKYQSAMSWISDLPVNNLFKLSLLRQSSVDGIDIESDNDESEDVIEVPDDNDEEIAVITDGLSSLQNNQEPSSFLRGSVNGLPKPLLASTPHYSDGSLVGLPSVPSKKKMNGFPTKDQKKSSDRSQMQQKPKRINGRKITPITNPGLDIDFLLDSSDSADEVKIVSETPSVRKLHYSAFSKKAMSPIPVFDSASNDLVGAFRSSVNCSSPCLSISSKSGSKLFTADEVIRLKEKEEYQKLLDKMIAQSTYQPVRSSEKTAIQVDLTRDEHEDAVMASCYNKEILRKPVNEFVKKHYAPCQWVRKISKCRPMIEDEIQENIPPPTSVLPEHRPIEKKSTPFSTEWLNELRMSIVEETKKRMEIVKQEEHTMKRLRERRDAKRQEEKRLYDKYKVPGDVFPEPGGGRDDYPELTPEMDTMVNVALQKYVGNDNDEMSTFNGVTVTRKHLHTLHEGTWLIDEVLNFYFNLIVERSKLDNYPSVYAFSTFFYSSINSRGINSVLRWTRKVDIFSYDIIFVPLHLGVHWALCVIDNRNKTIKYYDSMGHGHEQCVHIMQNYLIAEMKAKKNIVMDPDEYSLETAKDLPQQMNGSDCGMFTLKYAEYISRDAPITFNQDRMKYFRRRMAYEILTKQLM